MFKNSLGCDIIDWMSSMTQISLKEFVLIMLHWGCKFIDEGYTQSLKNLIATMIPKLWIILFTVHIPVTTGLFCINYFKDVL